LASKVNADPLDLRLPGLALQPDRLFAHAGFEIAAKLDVGCRGPAMLVAIVTAPGRPASAIIAASLFVIAAFRTA